MCIIILSEAYRAHQVLLNHAKQKRKGTIFVSPSSKSLHKPLLLHVGHGGFGSIEKNTHQTVDLGYSMFAQEIIFWICDWCHGYVAHGHRCSSFWSGHCAAGLYGLFGWFPWCKKVPNIFFFLTRDAFNLAHKGLVVVEIQVYQVYRIRTHRLSSVLSLFQPTIDILSVETLYAFLLRYDWCRVI